jgi:hypothetical protein
MIAADGDVYPLGDVEFLDPLEVEFLDPLRGGDWCSLVCAGPDRRQGGRPPAAGYATAPTAALAFAEVQGGSEGWAIQMPRLRPCVVVLSAIAADSSGRSVMASQRRARWCRPEMDRGDATLSGRRLLASSAYRRSGPIARSGDAITHAGV